jgi:enoyl-CoA hydratase
MDAQSELLVDRQGAALVLTLNRPQALNALTHTMVRGLAAALDAARNDPGIGCVVVTGAGERAFCAGGDIRQLHDLGRAGRLDEALTFWRDEYRLNIAIREFPKPYVALIDGIVMGGGVGVSLHGSHRLAGDRYSFAMPEVGIGFFPDVGASHALPRLPRHAGRYVALTGDRLSGADAFALGLVDACVPVAARPALIAALAAGRPVDASVAASRCQPEPAPIAAHLDLIDHCFEPDNLAGVLTRLREAAAGGSAFAERALHTIAAKSPTSLAIAMRQMVDGAALDFRDAMRMEFRIVSRIVRGHDFYEGVRAVIIDKDQKPKWQPERIEDIDAARIDAYFAPLGADELDGTARS